MREFAFANRNKYLRAFACFSKVNFPRIRCIFKSDFSFFSFSPVLLRAKTSRRNIHTNTISVNVYTKAVVCTHRGWNLYTRLRTGFIHRQTRLPRTSSCETDSRDALTMGWYGWDGMVCHEMTWHEMIWHCEAWYGTVWHGEVGYAAVSHAVTCQ